MMHAPPFQGLGEKIATARGDAGLTQTELARVLGIKQQSVSRWEAGTHRPPPAKLRQIETALKLPSGSFATQYLVENSPVAVVAPLLPLPSLAPEMFERFIGDLMAEIYPDREVRVQGGRGHDQFGWDILVQGGGEIIGIQCKREQRFGPANVKRVIREAEKPVNRAILALSRVASPATAEALRAGGWELWDQDDISRKIRLLPGERQDKLVDIYFGGQRLALLGRDNPGPWLKLDRFFAPFDRSDSAFTHRWHLVGRNAELRKLAAALSGDTKVAILAGPGGMGKSRLLRSALDDFRSNHPGVLLRFLSQVGELDHASLEALGTGPKLLVVDDAHDRDGLPLLIDYVSDDKNEAQLLLATRPYALQRIRNDLNRFAIFDPTEIELATLPKSALLSLITEAFAQYSDQDFSHWAEALLSISGENPLVAVMAAKVAAEGNLNLEQIRSAKQMRVVIERFTEVLTGRIGDAEDTRLLRDVLGLLALLQPVQVDDRQIGELLAAVTSHPASDATRALRMLIDGGVLYKRGRYFRLMPDLLGDHLIDSLCIQSDGRLSLFAEQVLEQIDQRLFSQVLVNLGRLDWRRHGGDPGNSCLLDKAWERFRDIEYDWDPRVDAIRKAAIYQPAQALQFVSERLRDGKSFSGISAILENIAYTDRYRPAALKLLWDMALRDHRDTGPHPSHPARILSELAAFGEHKPREFLDEMIDFAFALMDHDSNWEGPHTPLTIVAPILNGTIDQTSSNGRSITLSSAFVRYEFSEPIRRRVIDKIISLLDHPNPRIAAEAGRHVHGAVAMPYGMGSATPQGKLRGQYEKEFVGTIERITHKMEQLSPQTLLTVASSICWHADYGKGEPGEAAKKFLEALPSDIEFRLIAAMFDRWQFSYPWNEGNEDDDESELRSKISTLANDVARVWPDQSTLLAQVEAAIGDLAAARMSTDSAYLLMNELIDGNSELALSILGRAEEGHTSPMRRFCRRAMVQILEAKPGDGLDLLARYLDTDPDLASRTIVALSSLSRAPTAPEMQLLRRALTHTEFDVVRAGISTLGWTKELPETALKSLVLLVPFESEPKLLDEVAHLLVERRRKVILHFSTDEVRSLLDRMRPIKSLEGRWIESLFNHLAENFPLPFAEFLFERTDRSLKDEEQSVDLLGYKYREGKLGFHKSGQAADVLAAAWAWLRTHDEDDGYMVYRVVELVASMFDIDDENAVAFLDRKIDRADSIELKWIAKLVRHTHHNFVFQQRRFVERLLDRCAEVDRDSLEMAIDLLSGSAMSGMRSGTVGEPTKRDLNTLEKAETALATMPRFAAAFPLYEMVLKDAQRHISDSIREGQIIDEEEVE
ncbi:MAG: helix-turn-helix domain-containing protein [Sphingopyxis sp.]|nr:helix-turn-helix domain-containing protein [Sphingopyxis sp.]